MNHNILVNSVFENSLTQKSFFELFPVMFKSVFANIDREYSANFESRKQIIQQIVTELYYTNIVTKSYLEFALDYLKHAEPTDFVMDFK